METRKVALVTGASSGIGQATARLFAEKGYFVGLAARRGDRLETLARDLGDNGLPLVCNVRFVVVEPDMVRTELHPPEEFEQAIRAAGIEEPLRPEEIASAILYAVEQPEHVAVSEIMVRPVTQEL